MIDPNAQPQPANDPVEDDLRALTTAVADARIFVNASDSIRFFFDTDVLYPIVFYGWEKPETGLWVPW